MIPAIERTIDALARLPGLGRRTAERMALKLARERGRPLLREVVAALQALDAEVRICSRCGAITGADADPCRLCTDSRREAKRLCVVEDATDILQIEKSGGYGGRYHVLMGRLSPQRGESPRTLRVEALLKRVAAEGVEEVILALDTDVESDATAAWLHEKLEPLGVRVSRLASGLPAGSGIAYSDPLTLARAMEGRRTL